MLTQCRGIVLTTIPYGEKGIVVKIFTNEFGLQSYFVHGSKSSKKNTKSALFNPFSILEIHEYHNEKGQLQKLKDASLYKAFHHISTHPYKISITLFATEFLSKSLSEGQKDPLLFDFVLNFIELIEFSSSVAEAPISFIQGLIFHNGLYPELNFSKETPFFSAEQSCFVNHKNHADILGEEESNKLYKLFCSPLDAIEVGIDNRNDRLNILKYLIHYSRKHGLINSELKSLPILEMVMDG